MCTKLNFFDLQQDKDLYENYCQHAHCKFRRVVLTPRGHFRPFGKRVVSTPRKGRFNSKGSFDSMEGSK